MAVIVLLLLLLLVIGLVALFAWRWPSFVAGRITALVLRVLFHDVSIGRLVHWGLENVSFKIGPGVSISFTHLTYVPSALSRVWTGVDPLFQVELKGPSCCRNRLIQVGAKVSVNAAAFQPRYVVVVDDPSVSLSPPISTSNSKPPLVLRILQLPLVQKFLVLCLRALSLRVINTRLEISHEDAFVAATVKQLAFTTERWPHEREFARYTLQQLSLDAVKLSFGHQQNSFELFSLSDARFCIGFDAPRTRRSLEMVSLECKVGAIEAFFAESVAVPLTSFLQRTVDNLIPGKFSVAPRLSELPLAPPVPVPKNNNNNNVASSPPLEWNTSTFAFLVPNKGALLSVQRIALQFTGQSSTLTCSTRLEMQASCCSEHALGFDATFALHRFEVATSRRLPLLHLPLVQLRAVAELVPPSDVRPTTSLSFEAHLTIVEVSASYAHSDFACFVALGRSIRHLLRAAPPPSCIPPPSPRPVPQPSSSLALVLRSASLQINFMQFDVLDANVTAFKFKVERVAGSLQEIGDSHHGMLDIAQPSISMPDLSIDPRMVETAMQDGRVPCVVVALSSISVLLDHQPGQTPTVTVDISTVLAEISKQLLERILSLSLAFRRLQLALDAFDCTPILLPPLPSPSAPVTLPLSLSLWVRDMAVFVIGDLNDCEAKAPLLRISVPLLGVQLRPAVPHVTVQLHELALLHLGEADRVLMHRTRIIDAPPLLYLEHLELGVSLHDNRHVDLNVDLQQLRLDWTPATHLSAVYLVLTLVETILLSPPMPSLPKPFIVPSIDPPPPFVLSVNGQVSAIKLYISRLRLFQSRVAHLSSGTLFMGKHQYEHIIAPSLYIFWKEAPYAGCLNLFLDGHDPCWRIPFEFDFGETLGEILIVAKAVAGATAGDIVSLLDRAAKLHKWSKELPSATPSQPHKIILEGSLTNPQGQLVDEPFQVALANFWKISQDELVERRLRLECLEQRLADLKLTLASEAEFALIRAKALAKLAEEDARIYCQRARMAKERETSLLWCAKSKLLHARVGIDIGDEFLTERLLDLHRRSICFPNENLPKWDLILGLDYRVWGSDVVTLTIRDYPLPFVLVEGPVEVKGTATFAEEIPPPSALVQYRVNVSPSFTPTCIKTLTSVKVYYDMAGTCEGLVVTLGVGYRAGVKEMGNVFALMSPESSDWCPLLPWWDKMRQVLHGQLSVNVHKAQINYSGNMDPYNIKDVLQIHLERAEVLLRTECLNIAAARFGVNTGSHPAFMLDVGDFEATVKWNWRTKGNPHNHWVVPNKENLADTDPIEIDVAYAGVPTRPFVPGWQEPPPATWPIVDTQAEYRSEALTWDISLVLGPCDSTRPMFTLHPSMVNWFMRFGRLSSFPEIWLQETVTRRPSSTQLFSSVMERLNLRVQMPRRTALRFWEAKDQKNPLGFEVSIGELDFAIALEKMATEPGKEKKWTLQTRPFMAQGITATVLTPEGAQRWEAAHANSTARPPYDGDFLCSLPSASLTKSVSEAGIQRDRYRLEAPRLQWTKDARYAVYSWLDRFHQWRITLQNAGEDRKEAAADPAARKPTVPSAPRSINTGNNSSSSSSYSSLTKSKTSVELDSLFSEDASLPEEARNFFRPGASPARSTVDKHFELEVTEPRIILRADEAKGVLVFVGESFHLEGVSSVHREAAATRELTVLSLAWIGFSAHIAPQADLELSLATLRDQGEKCVITPCKLELGMTYSLSDAEDELERERDATIVKINIPSLSVSLASSQFQVLSAIINYLLLESGNNSNSRAREDQFASIMFKTQLEGQVKSLAKVREQTRRLRAELKDLESQLTDLRVLARASEEELAALERQVRTKLIAYLRSDQTLRGLILSQRKLRAAQQVHKTLTFKVEVLLGRVKWSLLLGAGNAPLAHATARSFDCRIMFFEDQSARYRFELGDMEIINCLPGAQHRNMFQLLNPQKWSSKDVILRMTAEQRAPVGGIFVYDHWELNLAPVNLQVSQGVYESLFEYFFPSAEEKLQVASTEKKKQEEEEEYDIKAKGLTDVEQMKLRARWFRSFVYVKITETEIGVTFKTLIERLRLKLNPIVYNGETWTFKELLGTLKKDIIWNLLFQAPSFVRAFTGSGSSGKEEKKENEEDESHSGALEALKRRLLLGESPAKKDKDSKKNKKKQPTPAALLPVPAPPPSHLHDSFSSRKGSEPPSLMAPDSDSSQCQSHNSQSYVDASSRRSNSASMMPDVAALMAEFGFGPPPDAPASEP